MDSRTYKTGELAKLAGITIRTLRYYDAIGLLKPSNVQENGHRQYNTTDVENLQLILGLKPAGLFAGRNKGVFEKAKYQFR